MDGVAELCTHMDNPVTLFRLLEKLGEGSYGSVHKAVFLETGVTVAVKIVPLADENIELVASAGLGLQPRVAVLASPAVLCNPLSAGDEGSEYHESSRRPHDRAVLRQVALATQPPKSW